MQGTTPGRKGIVLVLQGGVARFEDQQGETYSIYHNRGQGWCIIRDVWNEAAQDWDDEIVPMTMRAFGALHGITAIVD
jgi:hypothetical protein